MSNSPFTGSPQRAPAAAGPATRWRGLLLAALLLAAGSVAAGSFSVSPVRIYLQPRDRAVAITVTNEGDTEMVMQAEVFEWKQRADSSDELTPTDDVIMAPPVLRLAPKSRQVLRLANLRPVLPGQQLTYRLFVRELPEAIAPAPGAGPQVQVALAFSLPIFITPADARQRLHCAATGRSPDAVTLACDNAGQAYAQPVSFSLAPGGGGPAATQEVTGGYILPQMSRSFTLGLGGAIFPPGPATLTVLQDDGSRQVFDVLLAD